MHGLNFMLFLVSLPLFVAAIDNPFGKCSIKDNECFKRGWENVLKVLGPTGIPEVNADPIDPMIFNNITITIVDGFSLTITDGTLTGFKDCKFDKASLDLEKKLDTRFIICQSLKVVGKFSFGGKNPVLQSLFGSDSVYGHGDIKIKFGKKFCFF
ncbi:uncharacterized protein LOC123658232 [Melitaea cinxia]|uniref:uncharacterized protein LOC123658232 n=1 Tax=Melitaea cinxia TaxID=113334 RepID=UPI001E271D03|nr:uncharacterized protein LOC123658232 [Melitaea cinxia]